MIKANPNAKPAILPKAIQSEAAPQTTEIEKYSGNPMQMQTITQIPSELIWKQLREMGLQFYKSGMAGAAKSPEAATVIALTAWELKIPIGTAFRELFVTNGKTGMSISLMQTLAKRDVPGLKIETIESTDKIATVKGTRPSQPYLQVTFTIEDAKRAELLNKDNWKKYPRDMLWARACSSMLRKLCPETLQGMGYTPEELGDHLETMTTIETTGRNVPPSEEGALTPEVKTKSDQEPKGDPKGSLGVINLEQRNDLFQAVEKSIWSMDEFKKFIETVLRVKSTKEITPSAYYELVKKDGLLSRAFDQVMTEAEGEAVHEETPSSSGLEPVSPQPIAGSPQNLDTKTRATPSETDPLDFQHF